MNAATTHRRDGDLVIDRSPWRVPAGGRFLRFCALLLGVAGLMVLAGPLLRPATSQAQQPARLGGNDRFETAVLVSQHKFPDGADRLYAVRADVSPDALVGSFDDGPTLLVPSCGVVPESIIREVQRVAPEEIFVVGGSAAVSEEVAAQLQNRKVDARATCADDASDQIDLVLETRRDAAGLEVLGQIVNGTNAPVTVTRGYEIERRNDDGTWELIGPHLQDDADEIVPAEGTSEQETFVPYVDEDGSQRYLDPGTYRFGVNAGTDAEGYRPVRATLTVE